MRNSQPIITPLGTKHDRKSFDCNKRGLNDFLLLRALSPYSANTYVYVPEPDSPEIIAYFSLFPDPIGLVGGTGAYAPLLTRFIKLEYLAVDKKYQGKGIGTDLLIFIMLQMIEFNHLHIDGLAVEPLDKEAEAWFRHLDFGFEYVELPEPGLFLSMNKIRDAFHIDP